MYNYNVYHVDVPFGRRVVVSTIEGAQEIAVFVVYLQKDGKYQASYYEHFDNNRLAAHLRSIDLLPRFREVAGYLGEVAVYALYNNLTNRVTDLETFGEEKRVMESGPLTDSYPLELSAELTTRLADPCKIAGAEIQYAEEMLSRGEGKKTRESIDRLRGSLHEYSKEDVIGHLVEGVERRIYAPFDGLSGESRGELIKYVSIKIAELERKLTPPVLVS